MIRITSYRLLMILTFGQTTVRAMSLGPFIIFRDKAIAENQTVNVHEMIHFLQQIELLFLPMWILYLFFFLRGYGRGRSRYEAYYNIPFEREAYDNEHDIRYLIKRKPYAWTKYLKK